MRLLFVHRSLGKGGITSVIIDKMNYLAVNSYFEIHFLSEEKNNTNLEARLHKSIQLHCLDFENLYPKNRPRLIVVDALILRIKAKKLMQNSIEAINPDIISSLDDLISRELIPLIKTRAIKVVEFHDSIYLNHKNRSQITKFILRIHPITLIYGNKKKIHNKYDYAVALTNEDLEDRNYLKIKKKQIYNSYAKPENVSQFNKRDNIIIAVGSLIPRKNFMDLLAAINLIKHQIGSWKICIYGEGEQKIFLNQKIIDYGLSEIVYLKGFVYNIEDLYNNSKILISTSLSEGFGLNIMEALFFQIPVVSYNCKCGPKEIISDNVNGFLIDFEVKKLAERILKLISNPELLNQFSENTSIDLHKFQKENIMNEWIDFYNYLSVKKGLR